MKLASSRDVSSENFLHIEMIMLNNKTNKNGVCVTKDWIYQIVANQDKFIGLPLMCDVDSLMVDGDLTHLYDRTTDSFGTRQVGSFIGFGLHEENGACSLLGTARVPRRDVDIVSRLMALQERGELKFSYEIRTCDVVELDGVKYVTGSPDNILEGVAIVTTPAIPEAVALMVAEKELAEKEGDEIALDKKEKDLKKKEEELKQSEEVAEQVEDDASKKEDEDKKSTCKAEELSEDIPSNTEGTEAKEEEVVSEEMTEPEEPEEMDVDDETRAQLEAEVEDLRAQVKALEEELQDYKDKENEAEMAEKKAEIDEKTQYIDDLDVELSEEQKSVIETAKKELDVSKMDRLIAEIAIAESRVEKDTVTTKKETVTAEMKMTPPGSEDLIRKYFGN